MKKITIIFFVLSVIFSVSCEDNKIILPESNGKLSHVLVVMSKVKWKEKPGKELKKILIQDFPALPQSEPQYDISQIPESVFSDVMRRNTNIIVAKISSKVKKPGIKIRYNIWAKPQIIILISAKNNTNFVEILEKNKTKIIGKLDKAERNRIIRTYKRTLHESVVEKIKKNHNIKIVIPNHYKLDMDSSNFVWLAYETNKLTQAVLIWDYPYKDTSDFDAKNLIKARDSVTKINVSGRKKGSYMTTQKVYPFEYNKFKFNGNNIFEVRGLWEVKNGIMGGPFVSFSMLDKKRNRIVTADVFVYAGMQDKRNFVRQAEAVLYTLEIVK